MRTSDTYPGFTTERTQDSLVLLQRFETHETLNVLTVSLLSLSVKTSRPMESRHQAVVGPLLQAFIVADLESEPSHQLRADEVEQSYRISRDISEPVVQNQSVKMIGRILFERHYSLFNDCLCLFSILKFIS